MYLKLAVMTNVSFMIHAIQQLVQKVSRDTTLTADFYHFVTLPSTRDYGQ